MGLRRSLDKLRDWQRRSKEMSAGAGPGRKARMRKIRPDRKAKLLAEQFAEQANLCRHLPCAACNPGLYWPHLDAVEHYSRKRISDPHHTPTVGAGGKDRDTVPLCRRCHMRLDSPGNSEAALEDERGVPLRAVAAALRAYMHRQS